MFDNNINYKSYPSFDCRPCSKSVPNDLQDIAIMRYMYIDDWFYITISWSMALFTTPCLHYYIFCFSETTLVQRLNFLKTPKVALL